MDFSDTKAEAAFRERARAWLQANAERKKTPRDIFANGLPEDERLELARAWQRRKAEAGFAGITLPAEYGGAGGTPIEEVIYKQEESGFIAPFGFFEIGLGMCIPTLLAYGSEADKQRYVPTALRGEEIWCQLFSEPGAGSDLAGIRTRAVQSGENWTVNGQKVWTTGAQISDFGILLTRTHPDRPKHQGLTMFYVDMNSPGIEVRPITQMSGEQEFNEVFFTDVVIPDSHRLGEAGSGWGVALTTLKHERLTVGSDTGLIDDRDLLSFCQRMSGQGNSILTDDGVRGKLADWYIQGEGLRLMNYRAITSLSRGEEPGPEQSVAKIILASQAQEMANFAMDMLGEQGLLGSEILGEEWSPIERSWYYSAGMRIAGGSDEILRNIIAERILGLPPETRTDKEAAFKDLS